MKTIKIKKLVSTFKNSVGEKHNLTIKSPTVDKTPEEVHEALELLTTLDIFEEENGIKTFAEVVTAKYVETVKYIQFNPEAPVESEPLPEKPVERPVPSSIKPINYEKYIDLVCPQALGERPDSALNTLPIHRTDNIGRSLPSKDSENPKSSISEPSLLSNEESTITTPKNKKVKRKKGLIQWILQKYREKTAETSS
ncbi:DUF2922 domain-containing protein [Candidatus Enterococcus murrayae]|uniref:DUF2922 domain-containing protein n=1 Tax=Candidatus Enterococcus murrayae TaxID=2815321 RepID=A0ABS3HDM5_9ENTE|nr:DUF2922 domain-containing protein [Enterococcus sp. MJM16]MBO0451549.1 DUF2922 domain-containing protein [Enterococcus sp. MJM16]